MRTLFLPAALLLTPLAGWAEDAQIWHWSNNEVDLTRRVSLLIHGQARSKRPGGEWLQYRSGPILRYYIKPKRALVGGYFYRREPQPGRLGFGDSHRYFGGIEDYQLLNRKGLLPASLLESRFLVERFAGGPEGTLTNYTRFRHRNRFSFRDWKVSPMVGYEIFFFTNGLWGQRPHGGIRLTPNDRVLLDIAYMWDARTPRAGRQRPVLFTNLLIRFKRVPDPEFPNRPPF
ncbi:MAG: DUF2490 domain-containing protein [Bryobacteraceae bacterium]|nr:DUF2490 domain-containing protein [Bryobacteraceae bacterium]